MRSPRRHRLEVLLLVLVPAVCLLAPLLLHQRRQRPAADLDSTLASTTATVMAKKPINVLTLNLWFDARLQRERAQALCEYVLQHQDALDVLCFQEVTPPTFVMLRGCLRDAFAVSPMFKRASYGVTTFVHRKWTPTFSTASFPGSNQGRELLLTELAAAADEGDHGSGTASHPVAAIGNAHLESLDGHHERRAQLHISRTALLRSHAPLLVLCGDFNFDALANHPLSSCPGLGERRAAERLARV